MQASFYWWNKCKLMPNMKIYISPLELQSVRLRRERTQSENCLEKAAMHMIRISVILTSFFSPASMLQLKLLKCWWRGLNANENWLTQTSDTLLALTGNFEEKRLILGNSNRIIFHTCYQEIVVILAIMTRIYFIKVTNCTFNVTSVKVLFWL